MKTRLNIIYFTAFLFLSAAAILYYFQLQIIAGVSFVMGAYGYFRFAAELFRQDKANAPAKNRIEKIIEGILERSHRARGVNMAKDCSEAYLNLIRAREEALPWYMKTISGLGVIAFLVLVTTTFYQTMTSGAKLRDAQAAEAKSAFYEAQVKDTEGRLERAKASLFQAANHAVSSDDLSAEDICAAAASFYYQEQNFLEVKKLSDYVSWASRGNRWDVLSDINSHHRGSVDDGMKLVSDFMLGDVSDALLRTELERFLVKNCAPDRVTECTPGEIIQCYGIFLLLAVGQEVPSLEIPSAAEIAQSLNIEEEKFRNLSKVSSERSVLLQKRFRKWRRQASDR